MKISLSYQNKLRLKQDLVLPVVLLAAFMLGCGSDKEEAVLSPPEANQPNVTNTDEQDPVADNSAIVMNEDLEGCIDNVDCELIDPENEEKEADETTKDFMVDFDFTENLISSLGERFDEIYATFNQLLESRAEAISEAGSILSDLKLRMHQSREDWLMLKDLKLEWKDKLSPKTDSLCNDQRSLHHALSNARSQVLYVNDLLRSLEEQHAALSYSPRFVNIKEELKTKLDSLFLDYAHSRQFILDDSYDSKVETPAICEDINEAWADLEILEMSAKAIYGAKRAAAIAEKLRQISADFEAEELKRKAAFKVKNKYNEFFRLIHRGQVREAKELLDTISERLEEIVANSGLVNESVQLGELMEEVAITKEKILEYSFRIDNISSASIVLDTKLKRVRNLLAKAEIKSRYDADFGDCWEIQKVDIYRKLNTTPGEKFLMPRFKEWNELLDYEVLLDQIEITMHHIHESLEQACMI